MIILKISYYVTICQLHSTLQRRPRSDSHSMARRSLPAAPGPLVHYAILIAPITDILMRLSMISHSAACRHLSTAPHPFARNVYNTATTVWLSCSVAHSVSAIPCPVAHHKTPTFLHLAYCRFYLHIMIRTFSRVVHYDMNALNVPLIVDSSIPLCPPTPP